jgi:hypothetical protein
MTKIALKCHLRSGFLLIMLVATLGTENTARGETLAETAWRKIDELNAMIIQADAGAVWSVLRGGARRRSAAGRKIISLNTAFG